MKSAAQLTEGLGDRLRAMAREAGDSVAQFKAWAAKRGIRSEEPCHVHGWVTLTLDVPASAAEWRRKVQRPVFTDCPECRLSRLLAKAGVEPLMVECRFRTFVPQDDGDRKAFAAVQRFADSVALGNGGFIVLESPIYGNGKTHLAVAIMAHVGLSGMMFVTHAGWLEGIRAAYDGDKSLRMEERAKSASLLVFDELGVARHGKDEPDLMHRLFDLRYARRLPTVVTTNMPKEKLTGYLGERVADRMRHAASVIHLSGQSMRAKLRNEYQTKGTA